MKYMKKKIYIYILDEIYKEEDAEMPQMHKIDPIESKRFLSNAKV